MKELVRRWNAPTPKFWKKVRRNGAVLGIVGGLIAKVNPIIGGIILTIGTTISAVAQLTEE